MYRTLAGLLLALGAALSVVGLTFRASVEGDADFSFVNGTEPRTLDPALMTGAPEGRVADAIFEGLTFRDPASLRPVPGVAASWEISEDGRTYVFHLRESARWSDGTPVTAHDFAWSWRRFQSPAMGAEYAYILHVVRFAEAFNSFGAHADAIEGPILTALDELVRGHADGVEVDTWRRFLAEHQVHAALRNTPDARLQRALGADERLAPEELRSLRSAFLAEAERRRRSSEEAARRFGVDGGVFARDDRTLVVELVAPTPYFLELTAFYPTFPAPRWVVEKEGNDQDWFLPGKAVTNGPFLLDRWRVGDRIRLRKNPDYWNAAAIALESVDVLPIENTTTALNLYLTEAVDWTHFYPTDLVDEIKTRPDHRSGPGLIVYYYRFNTRREPLNDPRVRHAISLAIDRETIVDDVLGLGQLPAHHIVPPGMPGYEPPESELGFDPERARQLLAAAGHPEGKGISEIGILYNTYDTHKKIAELIADQLRRHLGLVVKPYNQEWQAYQASTLAGQFDIARAGWIGDYLDPNTFLDLWVTNAGNNQTGWGHALYDRLIHAAADVQRRVTPDLVSRLREPERARELLRAMSEAGDPAALRTADGRLRMHLFREAEAILFQEEFPVLPIYFYVVSNLVKPHVEGFHSELTLPDGSVAANLQDLHPLRGIRVTR